MGMQAMAIDLPIVLEGLGLDMGATLEASRIIKPDQLHLCPDTKKKKVMLPTVKVLINLLLFPIVFHPRRVIS
jgi:hypothetical protein